MEIEHFFTCPYCWQKISMILDLSAGEQSYIEDCEVCCRPINIGYSTEDFELQDFWAESIEQ
jgi:transcription elongation factor Elf1